MRIWTQVGAPLIPPKDIPPPAPPAPPAPAPPSQRPVPPSARDLPQPTAPTTEVGYTLTQLVGTAVISIGFGVLFGRFLIK